MSARVSRASPESCALFDLVERERRARRLDGVLDERHLAHLLVRPDDEALDDAGVDAAADRDDDIERDGQNDRKEPLRKGLIHSQPGARQRRDDEHAVRGHARVHVDVRGAEDDARLLGQEMRDAEPRAKRQHQQERGREKRKMPARSGAGHDAAQRIEPQVAGGDMRAGDADSRQDDRRQRDAVEELQHRQPEQVEGDVASEDRIDLAEGNRVCRVEPRRP